VTSCTGTAYPRTKITINETNNDNQQNPYGKNAHTNQQRKKPAQRKKKRKTRQIVFKKKPYKNKYK